MTTMIERVARAICKEGSFCCQNSETFCHAMDWHEDAARAAIEAMRPLIDAMDQLLDDMGDDGLCVCSAAKKQARKAFEPFAALAEGERG